MHAWVVTSSPPGRGRTVGGSCRRVPWSMAPGVVVILADPFDHAQGMSLICGSSRRSGGCCRGVRCTASDEVGRQGCC